MVLMIAHKLIHLFNQLILNIFSLLLVSSIHIVVRGLTHFNQQMHMVGLLTILIFFSRYDVQLLNKSTLADGGSLDLVLLDISVVTEVSVLLILLNTVRFHVKSS